ncbi:MAG: DUF423 domain-containing protein [Planctomycetota bacterium]|nr:DUF423 domain-containing protein [Planctomycetota bacterium]MDA1211033.1 DUF423 domain-containing protein [Planctomycetota bacterium]
MKTWTITGAIFGGLAVVLGAFAAHGLDQVMVDQYASMPPKVVAGFSVPASWKYLQDFKTGAEYQMYHALALLALGVLTQQRTSRWATSAGWSFTVGILLFSGSLYLLALTGETKWGMVAPIGGTLLIVGWALFAVAALQKEPRTK